MTPEAAKREQDELEQRDAQKARDAWRWLLDDPRGIWLAWRWLTWSGLGDGGPTDHNGALVATGRRQMGALLREQVLNHDPEAWVRIQAEDVQGRLLRQRLEQLAATAMRGEPEPMP